MSYDPVGQLTTQIDTNAAAQPISTMIDSYDGFGNRTGRTRDGVVFTWIYDAINRLTKQHSVGAWASFTYDSVGNTKVKWYQGQNPITMTFNPDHQLVHSYFGATISTFARCVSAGSVWPSDANCSYWTLGNELGGVAYQQIDGIHSA